jgi:hypothetical protein
MKKFLFFILSMSTTSFAEMPSEQLAKFLESIRKHYPPFISSTYDTVLDQELTRQLGDFHYSIKMLQLALGSTGYQLHTANRAFAQILEESDPVKRDRLFLEATWLLYSTQKLAREAAAYPEIIKDVDMYWGQRCNAERAKVYTDLLDPIKVFPRDNFGKVQLAGIPSLQVSMTVNPGSKEVSAFAHTTDETSAVIITAGTAIGSLFPGPGTAIGFAIGSLVAALRSMFMANTEFNKQLKLLEDIRNAAIGATEEVSKARATLYLDKCKSLISKDDSQLVQALLALLQERAVKMADWSKGLSQAVVQMHSEYPEKLRNNMQEIERTYLSSFKQSYADLHEKRLASLIETDEASEDFYYNEVLPRMPTEKNSFLSLGENGFHKPLLRKIYLGRLLYTKDLDGRSLPEDRQGLWKDLDASIVETLKKESL